MPADELESMFPKRTPLRNNHFERIKIAFVIDTLFSGFGGTESQLLKLIDHIDLARFEPFLFCLRSSEWIRRKSDFSNLRILDISVSLNPGLLGKIWSFSRILRHGGFHIVQTHFRDANIVGTLAARLAVIDTVISTRRGEPYWRTRAGLLFLKRLNDMATCFVANSNATKSRYTKEEGIDPARVEVIYNGIEGKQFQLSKPHERIALRQSLGLPPEVPIVGIVANLRPVKGLADFLLACQLVSRNVPDTHFVIIGEGDEREPLEHLARKLDLHDRVHFLGRREDVPQLLQIMDVGVLASHSESFSNSILEYLAAGLPVVVTDVGGVREVVRGERDGFIVAPRAPDQMAQRLEFLIAQTPVSRRARHETKLDSHFYLDSMVNAYEALYTFLASKRIPVRESQE